MNEKIIDPENLDKLTRELTENVKQVNKIKSSFRWFQVLFIVVAMTQLAEYANKMSGESWYGQLSILFAPVITGVIALGILRPWRNDPDFSHYKIRKIILGILLFLLFVFWWSGAFIVGKDTKKIACIDPFSLECKDWFFMQKIRHLDCWGTNPKPEYDYLKYRKKMLE